MCGIAGVFSIHEKQSLEVVKRMTDSLRHRGPDGEGIWERKDGALILGHRRLAILDLTENASQPMPYAEERYHIVFNGEIYNYIELREELETQGYRFQSNSDTEVLLALYDQRKEKCLEELDGMFAFAIWDEQERSLFCARDRFGEKPFYYFFDERKGFYFASEMKALWAAGIHKVPDPEMWENYLQFSRVMDPKDQSRTFYKSISQLENGQYLLITSARFKPVIKKYYGIDLIRTRRLVNENDIVDEFRALLKESVRKRLRSDVPVGSSLSGGLDSSTIVMLMDQLGNGSLVQKTFSARFRDFERDEGEYISAVLDKCKSVKGFSVWPQKEEMDEVITKLIYHQEEPFISPTVFAQWKVMELARKEGVLVLLDGQGADEQLAGYLYYYNHYLSQLYHHSYSEFQHEVSSFEELRGIQHALHPRNHTVKMRLGRIKRRFFKEEVLGKDHLSRQLLISTMTFGLKELLRYADRNSMAHSVEVRLPFLDHKLVEFVFSLPDRFKLRNGWTKYILRESMKDLLPEKIAWRVGKVGYETPDSSWLSGVRGKGNSRLVSDWLNDLGVANSSEITTSLSDWQYYYLLKMRSAS